jgi:hypothetical protein
MECLKTIYSSESSIVMSNFWEILPSDRYVFVLADGSTVTYAQLAEDVRAFGDRLSYGRGLIGIQCNGDYRQYVMYLCALNVGCPVVLMQKGQRPELTGLSLTYLYDPFADILSYLHPDVTPECHCELALLLPTSGSTGAAKWVRLSYANIQANASSIASYLALTSEDRAPMALPFQYSYGMSVLNSHLAVGGTLVLTEGSVLDPDFWKMFEAACCTSFAGVPHSFDLMDQRNVRTDHLKHLRYITQAGGRLAPSQVKAWAERGRAEGWDFFVMYGQTEASPRISYLPPQMALEVPASIGIAVPGGEIWVADDNGVPVADGKVGELTYRGPNTMMGYACDDADLATGQGSNILSTGDIARRLTNGGFEIVGRKSRFVKLFGYRVSLDEVEKYLSTAGIKAICGAQDEVMYVLLPRDQDGEFFAEEVAFAISNWLKIPVNAFRVTMIDTIPRTGNGKVDKLAVDTLISEFAALSPKKSPHIISSDKSTRGSHSVVDVFREHFAAEQVTPAASFNSLGGDSLSYLSVAQSLEEIIGRLPSDWGNMAISELQTQVESRDRIAFIDTPTLVRAISIVFIVMGHLNVWNYGGGGAFGLFVVAGWSFAAFTLPQVLSSDRVLPIAALALRVAILTLGWNLCNYAMTSYGEWPAFLFVGNWLSPDIEGSAWFVDVYLQTLAVLSLLFALSVVRRAVREQPFWTATLSAMAFVVVAAVSDVLVDTNHLDRRLPHLMAWIFFLGVALQMARSNVQRSIVTAIGLAGIWQFNAFGTIEQGFFLIAVIALIWLPVFPLPRWLLKPIRMVAGASLVIYLTHFQFASLAKRFGFGSPEMAVLTAILGGIIAWRFYAPIDAWLSHRFRQILSDRDDKRSNSPR